MVMVVLAIKVYAVRLSEIRLIFQIKNNLINKFNRRVELGDNRADFGNRRAGIALK